MTNFLVVMAWAFFASIIALVGGVIFVSNVKKFSKLNLFSVPFAAGVLLTVALLGLLPESVELIGTTAFMVVLISFFTAYLFENFIFDLHHHQGHQHKKSLRSSMPLVIIGDTIHNFIDGIAIGASFLTDPSLGISTVASTFLHEVPHEIADFGIMIKAGWSRKKVIIVNVISALFTLPGAALVYYFADNPKLNGVFLAIAAGLFLYLGASDFLPQAEEEAGDSKYPVLALLIGVGVMMAVFLLIPE